MNFRVELTATAYADLHRHTEWIETDHQRPEPTDDLNDFTKRSSVLNPGHCLADSPTKNRFFSAEIRHLLFEVWKGKPYRALFSMEDDVVKVLCIRAPGEKPVKPKDIEF